MFFFNLCLVRLVSWSGTRGKQKSSTRQKVQNKATTLTNNSDSETLSGVKNCDDISLHQDDSMEENMKHVHLCVDSSQETIQGTLVVLRLL